MRALCSLAGFVACLSAVPAFAINCDDAATQSDMTSCYGHIFESADAALNTTYRKIERRLGDDPDTKKRLVTAERAWIAFRDAECAFSNSGIEGGSIYPMMLSICLADLTTERTRQLETFLECEEGDPSCPVPGE